MLDFRIDTFLAVCKFMNFTKASQYLNITQPAVSGHIRYLEEYYGIKLFVYQGKKMQLTLEGKILLAAATTLKHDDIFLKSRMQSTVEKQELIFGATLSVGEYLMPPVIEGLLKTNQQLSIKMKVANTSKLLSLMNEGEIDFAVVEGYFNKIEYDYLCYCQEEFIAVAGVGMKIGPVNDVSELFKYNLIVREIGSGSREIIERALEDRNLRVGEFVNVVEMNNIKAIKHLVMANQGITFIYKMAVAEEIAQGKLQQINIKELNIFHDINFIWRKNSIFVDYYQQLFGQFRLQKNEGLL